MDSKKKGSRRPLKSVGKRKGTGQDESAVISPKGLFKPKKPFEGKRNTVSQKRLFTSKQSEDEEYAIKPAAGGRPVKNVEVGDPKSSPVRSVNNVEIKVPKSTSSRPARASQTSSESARLRPGRSSSVRGKPGTGAKRISRQRKQPAPPAHRQPPIEQQEEMAAKPAKKKARIPAHRQPPQERQEEVTAKPAKKRVQAPAHLSPTRKPPLPQLRRQQIKHPPRVDPKEDALRKKAVPYQWGQTAKFSADQKKFLERIFTQFAENITTKMAPLLQTRVNITYDNAKLRLYSTFVQSLYEPIALLIMRMDPETKGLMVIDFPLSFALIDRCLGGAGQALEEIRYFTEIEIAVLERVVVRLMESYQEAWTDIRECKPQYLEMQFNPQTVHIVKPSDTMVCVTFTVQVAQASGPIYVIIPFDYLNSILPKSNFEEFMLTRTAPSQVSPSVAPLFAKNLDTAKVPLSVELGYTELPFGELAVLEVGDFIKLDQEITEPLKVKVNNRVKFLGRPGVRDRKMSVQITKVLQEGDEELYEQ
ncbi:MAG: FliM/FliN family flagellar motor switch protein [Candidatus Eremiobacteraeota bacterium]|nr:FliM/FliN family flagellar motor switch protein [Candidatus Eremiobacteraeota bacterium]